MRLLLKQLKNTNLHLKKNHVDVKTELMKNPPDISVDREQIKAAFANLIENAIEAMRNKTRILRIGSRVSEGYIEINVSDTGVGIPKDKLKNILDPFFTSKIHAGLGLTYALKIIQAHSGTISVESEPGKGSTFTIRLPVKRSGK